MGSIFIQIASYRDPELYYTILDLLNNAKNKNLLSFGICDQYDSTTVIDYTVFNHSKIKILRLEYQKSHGACWARSLTQSLYNNEDFTLQIDSHTRSEPGWDKKLLDLYYTLKDNKAILSTYPSMYTPGNSYTQYNKAIYGCHVYQMQNGFISVRPARLIDKSKPLRSSAVAAGFIFGPGSIINDIKYDPEFYFSGEEAALALRFFTNGYNLYHPNINLFYHYYTRKNCAKHWNDHKNWWRYSNRATEKLNCLLGRNKNFNLGEYGLGSIRSIEDWKNYSGIDYKNNRIHKHLIENKEPPFLNDKELWIDAN